ncbi:DNA-3-methyladenine glycosylase family protein [Comamonas composti]|uniref:DNA-3-methyladenine glycosylase family protein n=1 Tax=Comamonas composti TaxID=408558 RepID=UPI0003FB276F|nr:DNA-3-methyladenine glycosylase [Comamonas composti]
MIPAKLPHPPEFEQLQLGVDLPVPEAQPEPLPVAPMGAAAKPAAKSSASAIKLALPEDVPAYWADACRQLMRRDRVMKRLIPRFAHLAPKPRTDAFATLARSLVGQQISAKSAQALWNRFTALPAQMTPELVLKLKVDDMRAAGLSARKIDYLVDLALHFTEHRLHQEGWQGMTDEAIVAELMSIRGVGRWTAEMFLIFHLQRPNVLPLDDAGLISGISSNYFSGDPVSRSEAREVAEAWKPWCTVATWYIWRSLEPLPAT